MVSAPSRWIARSRALLLALVCISLLCSCARLSPQKRVEEAVSWLPADTVAMVSIRNVDQMRERWDQTNLAKAWSDTTVEYWRSRQLDPVVNGLLKQGNNTQGRELLKLLKGEVVLAVAVPASSDKPLQDAACYAIADFGSNAEKAREILAKTDGKVGQTWIKGQVILACPAERVSDIVDRRKASRAWFFKGRKQREFPALSSNPAWQTAIKERSAKDDVFVFVDASRLHDPVLKVAQKALQKKKKFPLAAFGIQILDTAAGAKAFQTVSASTTFRDKGFYTRSLITWKRGSAGLLVPYGKVAPLQTPEWVPNDVESFTALRIRPPLEMEQSVEGEVNAAYPFLEGLIKGQKQKLEKQMNFSLDTLFGGLGSEVAVFSMSDQPMSPDFVMLWEVRDGDALNKSLDRLKETIKAKVSNQATAGYNYQVWTLDAAPMVPFFTARVGNFFMLSLKDQWLQGFATRQAKQQTQMEKAKNPSKVSPAADSLVPVLDEPFEKPERGMVVVGRSYNNPVPKLQQLQGFLPMVLPMANLQLQKQGMPTIPAWVPNAIPPLTPFANNAFPTVGRTLQKQDGEMVMECYSASIPAASPIAAAAFVIGGKMATEAEK